MSTLRTLVTAPALALALGLSPLLAGCDDGVDVKEALVLDDVVTGWFDAGIQGGKNKLVPSISFRVKNQSASTVRSVQLNAVFRIVGDEEELGAALVRGIDGNGLPGGQTTDAFVLRSTLGYTGEQARSDMLQHGQFQDAQVEVFAKHGSRQWVKLGQYPVTRQLLTR